MNRASVLRHPFACLRPLVQVRGCFWDEGEVALRRLYDAEPGLAGLPAHMSHLENKQARSELNVRRDARILVTSTDRASVPGIPSKPQQLASLAPAGVVLIPAQPP